jgi:coenzyme Q-binding protein COQ10
MRSAFQRALLTTHHCTQQRRGFFDFTKYSFPTLPQSGPEENQTYHERKIFPYVNVHTSTVIFLPKYMGRYRRSEVYEVIADVESYPNFVPYCTGSRTLESEARRDGITVMQAELTVGFLAFKESYTSTVTSKPHEFVKVSTFCLHVSRYQAEFSMH